MYTMYAMSLNCPGARLQIEGIRDAGDEDTGDGDVSDVFSEKGLFMCL